MGQEERPEDPCPAWLADIPIGKPDSAKRGTLRTPTSLSAPHSPLETEEALCNLVLAIRLHFERTHCPLREALGTWDQRRQLEKKRQLPICICLSNIYSGMV